MSEGPIRLRTMRGWASWAEEGGVRRCVWRQATGSYVGKGEVANSPSQYYDIKTLWKFYTLGRKPVEADAARRMPPLQLEKKGRREEEEANMQYVIQKATLVDLAEINAIYNHYVMHSTCVWSTELVTESERRAWYEAHGEKMPVLVARCDGRVV